METKNTSCCILHDGLYIYRYMYVIHVVFNILCIVFTCVFLPVIIMAARSINTHHYKCLFIEITIMIVTKAVQREDESVTMWGLRIEEILQRAMEKGEVPPERKNHLLKDKFWRSLHSLDLKIATKVHFDKVADFEVLRSKVREEERELQTHKTTFEKSASSMTANNKQDTSGELQHQPIQTARSSKDVR